MRQYDILLHKDVESNPMSCGQVHRVDVHTKEFFKYLYSIQTAPGRCCELILGPVRDFGKALRIALCQRGVQNQLRGLQMLRCICPTGWNAGFHNWVMVGYGFELLEYCRRERFPGGLWD